MSIGTPIRLRNGRYHGRPGTYWAWPIDGYFDLHHAPYGEQPDGADVVEELFPTLDEARAAVRRYLPVRVMGIEIV